MDLPRVNKVGATDQFNEFILRERMEIVVEDGNVLDNARLVQFRS